ncbi:MAG: 23S rRNA (adenine(2030)-N(6))-methyltransferase RlmJ [Verrucomicrobiota bacterium]
MNYRHHYHAGNFADVFKHAALVQLVRALQRKDKGFLYLDTHSGRGTYDLLGAARGLTLDRAPEWPEGVGRLLDADPATLSPALRDYLQIVRAHDAKRRAETAGTEDVAGASVRHYPGSPRFVQNLVRPQDRLVLCELHPDESALLADEFRDARRVRVESVDGYAAIKAHLPPLERRALVLIDPPFEAGDEFARVAESIDEALRRLPSAIIAIWYPLTERARSDTFLDELADYGPPPTCAIELTIAGPDSPQKMRGCGLIVINPPWQLAPVLADLAADLATRLAQTSGGGSALRWIAPEA